MLVKFYFMLQLGLDDFFFFLVKKWVFDPPGLPTSAGGKWGFTISRSDLLE